MLAKTDFSQLKGVTTNERINFKKVDRVGINRYDSPAALYYKLVFYFTEDSGLLGLNGVFSDDLVYYKQKKLDLLHEATNKVRNGDKLDIDEFNRNNQTVKKTIVFIIIFNNFIKYLIFLTQL